MRRVWPMPGCNRCGADRTVRSCWHPSVAVPSQRPSQHPLPEPADSRSQPATRSAPIGSPPGRGCRDVDRRNARRDPAGTPTTRIRPPRNCRGLRMVMTWLRTGCDEHEVARGIRAGIVAYTIWGLLTIYWKQLRDFDADRADRVADRHRRRRDDRSSLTARRRWPAIARCPRRSAPGDADRRGRPAAHRRTGRRTSTRSSTTG